MKKVLIFVALVAIVSTGLFASDIAIGVNLKGFDDFDPMVSVELGFGNDAVVSPYLQIGVAQASALAGAQIKLGNSPTFLFGGAGMTLAQKTVTTTVTSNVDGVVDNDATIYRAYDWHEYHIHEVEVDSTFEGSVTTTYTDSYMVVLPMAEIGAGVDMGGLLSKIGYTYVGNGETNNHGFTFSMALSL